MHDQDEKLNARLKVAGLKVRDMIQTVEKRMAKGERPSAGAGDAKGTKH